MRTSSSTTTRIFTALSRDVQTTAGWHGWTTCDLIEETERLVRMSVAAVRGPKAHKFVEEHNAIISAFRIGICAGL